MYRIYASPLHKIARFFTLLAGAYLLQMCVPKQDVATPPVTLPTNSTEVQPYQLVPFTPTNAEFKSEKYTATFGNQPITLVRQNKNLILVVPEIAAGKQLLRVAIDGKTYEQSYTVSAGQVITPTQAKQVAQAELTKEDDYIKKLDTYLSNTPNLRLFVQAKTVAKLKQANADFRKALTSATDADVVILAKFLTVNSLISDDFESLRNGRQTAGEDTEFMAFDGWFTKTNASLKAKLALVAVVTVGVGVFFTPLAGGLVGAALLAVVMTRWVDQQAGFIQKGAAVIIEDGAPALESRSAVDPKESARFNKANEWPNDIAAQVNFNVKRRTWWDKRFSGRAMHNKMMAKYALLKEAYELLVSFIGDIEPVVDLTFLETKEILTTASAFYFKTGRVSNPNVTIKKQETAGEKLIVTLASSVTATNQPFSLSMDYERVDGDVLTTVMSGTIVTSKTSLNVAEVVYEKNPFFVYNKGRSVVDTVIWEGRNNVQNQTSLDNGMWTTMRLIAKDFKIGVGGFITDGTGGSTALMGNFNNIRPNDSTIVYNRASIIGTDIFQVNTNQSIGPTVRIAIRTNSAVISGDFSFINAADADAAKIFIGEIEMPKQVKIIGGAYKVYYRISMPMGTSIMRLLNFSSQTNSASGNLGSIRLYHNSLDKVESFKVYNATTGVQIPSTSYISTGTYRIERKH